MALFTKKRGCTSLYEKDKVWSSFDARSKHGALFKKKKKWSSFVEGADLLLYTRRREHGAL
jgi:hypothetical protein